MKAPYLEHLRISELFRQLALLLQSGVRVCDGLRILAEEEDDKEYVRLLLQMAEKLEDGQRLTDVLTETGRFPAHVLGLVETGEQVGREEETFLALSRYYAHKEHRNRKLKESLSYPCILLGLMLVVIVVLLTRVLPIFNEVYSSLGSGLSGAARLLLVAGNGLNRALPYMGIAFGVVIVLVALIWMLPGVKAWIVRVYMRLLGDSGIHRKMNNASYVQSLAVAASCGTTFEEGVELASKMLCDNPRAWARSQACVEMIRKGMPIDEALQRNELMSRSSCYLLKLGLRAGKGDETMQEIAERMAREADEAVEKRLARIEPALVILTSLITGAILLTVMLPLIDIMNTIG